MSGPTNGGGGGGWHRPDPLKWLSDNGLLGWAVAGAVGATIWAISSVSDSRYTARDLRDTKIEVAQEFLDLKTSMTAGFNGLQVQIANLPDYAVRLHVVEQHDAVVDTHLSALDGRDDLIERTQYQHGLRLDELQGKPATEQGPK